MTQSEKLGCIIQDQERQHLSWGRVGHGTGWDKMGWGEGHEMTG